MKPEKIKQMCESKFATHKATLIQDTDRYLIIDWQRADKSNDYYVNYIVDKLRGSLIVSGDLGDSIATWYNPIDPSNLKKWITNDTGYYVKKLQCTSDKYVYNEDDVLKDIKDYLKHSDTENIIEAYNTTGSYAADTENEVWSYIEDEIYSSVNGNEFQPTSELINFCKELDTDYYEWLYDCGKSIHPRIYLWAEGLYRACEQLGI